VAQLAGFWAHSLGNPLTGLSLSLELLSGALPANLGPGDRLLDRARRALTRLLALKQFMEALHPDAHSPQQSLDSAALLHGLVAEHHLLPDYGATVHVGPGAQHLWAQPALLAEALEHIVRDAIDSSPAGCGVALRVEATAHSRRISVVDTGPCRPLPQLSTEPAQGAHLQVGLLLAAVVVEHCHRGRITFQHGAPHGREVILELPWAPGTLSADREKGPTVG
jgi:hypothetical protein